MQVSDPTASMPSERSIRYSGWRVTAAAAGCAFVSFGSLGAYTFGIFAKPVATEFGWSRQAMSTGFALAVLTFGACAPFMGLLIDRYPAKRIILPCFAVFGCAFASLSVLTPHLWHLYAVFFLMGIVGNGTAFVAYTRVLATWFHQQRGAAFALLMAGSAVGAMVFPPLAAALIHRLGWRGAYGVLGLMALIVGMTLGRFVRESPTVPISQQAATMDLSANAKSSPIFWIIITVLFCSSVGRNAVITHLSALLTDRGISPAEAALAMSAMGGALLAGRLITGWLLDRYFAPRIYFILLASLAAGVILLSSARSLTTGCGAALLIGFGMGGELDVTPYLLAKYFGLRSLSMLYGLTLTVGAIAAAIGPIIMARAFDKTGSYHAVLLQLATLTIVGASLLFLLPRYKNVA